MNRNQTSSHFGIDQLVNVLKNSGGIMQRSIITSIIISTLLLVSTLNAQIETLWTQHYSPEETAGLWDYGQGVAQTSDGGFIFAGVTGTDWDHNANIYIFKTDADGDTLWTRSIGHPDYNDNAHSIRQTSDGGYILTGFTYNTGGNMADAFLLRTDEYGDSLWMETFGGSDMDMGHSVVQTRDGGYVFTGFTGSTGAGSYDVLVVKTDSSGQAEWVSVHGGVADEKGNSVLETSDGGFIVAGHTESYGAGRRDMYLVKVDASGNEGWTRTFGGVNNEESYSVIQSSDGGYVVAGYTELSETGEDVYLVKVDELGVIEWDEAYGKDDAVTVTDDRGKSVIEASDGSGYVVAALTSHAGNDDILLIGVDHTSVELWSVAIEGAEREIPDELLEAEDGGFVIVGYVNPMGEITAFDAYVVRTTAPILARIQDLDLQIEATGSALLGQGDVLEFRTTIANNGDRVVEGDYWIAVELPNGVEMLLTGDYLDYSFPLSGQVFPNGLVELNNELTIVDEAEVGIYRLIGRIGSYPDMVIDEDSFEFQVIN